VCKRPIFFTKKTGLESATNTLKALTLNLSKQGKSCMNDKIKTDLLQEEEKDNLTIDWINEDDNISPQNIENEIAEINNHLSPVKHPQQDFFIADIFDAISFQTDMASLEYPLFVLKAGDTKPKHFEINGFKIDIRTSLSHATIHDKDIWIYCISKIMQAKKRGRSYIKNRTFYDL